MFFALLETLQHIDTDYVCTILIAQAKSVVPKLFLREVILKDNHPI